MSSTHPAKVDSTTAPDEAHTYGLVFRLFAGNGKELTRWFGSEMDRATFIVRNAITVISYQGSEDRA